jgi:predicted peroxiredoxin
MKKLILSAALAAFAAGTAFASSEAEEKLVTVVTSPDAQTQLMAMVLTMQAAQQGADTHIMLCGPAGDLALKDAPASATAGQPPRDMSPQGLMQMIRQKTGATVEVCAIYLPGKGADQSVLLDGIGVAKPDEMARRLMDEDTRVLNY